MTDPQGTRRDFVSYLAAAGLTAVTTSCAHASAGAAPPAAPSTGSAPPQAPPPPPTDRASRAAAQPPIQLPPARDDGPWDMSWLERLPSVEHKLMFDVAAYLNGGGLYYARNYLNGMRDGWGIEPPRVLPLLGVSGDAYPLIFGDAIWEKFRFGESSKTTDPRTRAIATRNVFWKPRAGEPMEEFGVDVLQARGCQLLFCNNVFRGVIRRAMRDTGRPYAEVRAELKAGMLPGVIVVPAMVAGMALAQSKGAGYVFAGV